MRSEPATADRPTLVGVFGGTFDPVHYGHLLPALEAARALGLAEVRFVPAARPPHRPPPAASAAHRVRMLALALAAQPEFAAAGFRIDERELTRAGPSYTVDTLQSLRSEMGAQPIGLLLGTDAFMSLPTWHRWQELIGLAHLVVLQRPGWAMAGVSKWAADRLATAPPELIVRPAGAIWFQDVTPREISSTRIREFLSEGRSVTGLLPEVVRDYIESQQLYREKRT